MKEKENCCGSRTNETQHADHTKELHRLNRIRGQLEGVARMIEERRYCPDIVTQIQAIRSALTALQKGVLERHLKGCVEQSFLSKDRKKKEQQIEELLTLFSKLSDS